MKRNSRIIQQGMSALLVVTPLFASAAGVGSSFRDLVLNFGRQLSGKIIPILVALAVLAFFFNLVFFIFNMNNETERVLFKGYTINAIIALTILLTMWGIIGIFTNTFFQGDPVIPQFPTGEYQ